MLSFPSLRSEYVCSMQIWRSSNSPPPSSSSGSSSKPSTSSFGPFSITTSSGNYNEIAPETVTVRFNDVRGANESKAELEVHILLVLRLSQLCHRGHTIALCSIDRNYSYYTNSVSELLHLTLLDVIILDSVFGALRKYEYTK